MNPRGCLGRAAFVPTYEYTHGRLDGSLDSYVRYVPWLPTPLLGVAELNPPSGTTLCGGEPLPAAEGAFSVLDCGEDGGTIDAVTFASFGSPSGHCGSFRKGVCHAPNTQATVDKSCLGQRSCTVPSSADTFPGLSPECLKEAALAVATSCTNKSKQFTYWNFTLLDHQVSGDGSRK